MRSIRLIPVVVEQEDGEADNTAQGGVDLMWVVPPPGSSMSNGNPEPASSAESWNRWQWEDWSEWSDTQTEATQSRVGHDSWWEYSQTSSTWRDPRWHGTEEGHKDWEVHPERPEQDAPGVWWQSKYVDPEWQPSSSYSFLPMRKAEEDTNGAKGMLDDIREAIPTISKMLHSSSKLTLKAAAKHYAQNVRIPDGRLYICGGCDGRTNGEVECFNHKIGLWVRMAPMFEPRSMHTGSVIEGQLYVVGGRSVDDGHQTPGIRMDTVERFNPDLDEWERLTPMSTARVFHSASVIEGKLYIVGGMNPRTCLSSIERYHPKSEEWETLRPMTTRRCLHTASVIGGQLYIAGGSSGIVPWQPEDTENSMERFNPAIGRWETMGAMALGRYVHTATVMGGYLYVTGGKNGTVALDSVERYNPTTDAWEILTPLSTPRRFHTASVVNGELYVVGGGEFHRPSQLAERFSPKLGRWERIEPTSGSRMLHSASVIDGKLYVVGGVDIDTVECFNPRSGTWEAAPPMLRTHRFHHSASLVR